MHSTHQKKTTVFSPVTTWIGLLILASALLHPVVTPAQASSSVASATTSFSSFDQDQGVFTGGQRQDFPTGLRGFGSSTFLSLGMLAMERTLGETENRRDEFQGSSSSVALTQGGTSVWTTTGMFFPRADQTLLLTNTVGLENDTASWSTRVQSLISGSMTNNRIVWDARLVESFVPVYTTGTDGVLLISDSSGNHPAIALQASSTAGVLVWGGPGGFQTPLTNQSRVPTAYVHSVTSNDFIISVVMTLVDHDPCSAPEGLALAGQVAGVVGSHTPSITSCLETSTWSAAAGETTTLGLALAEPAREVSEGQTRVLEISGLPDGVTLGMVTGANSALEFDLSVSEAAPVGNYDVSVRLRTKTTIGGVDTLSEPFSADTTLTITPLVVPEPEPEPEPEAEPEVKPEPEQEQEPEVEAEEAEESGEQEETVVEVEQTESVGTPVVANQSGGGSSIAVDVVVPEQNPEVFLGPVFVEPDVLEPRLTPVVPGPVETPEPYFEPIPVPSEAPETEAPEPMAASTWLGASMMAVLALGSLWGFLRRRRS